MINQLLKILLLWTLSTVVFSKGMELTIPILEDSPNQHHFFFELLTKSFEKKKIPLKLNPFKLPQLRVKNYLDQGKISIYWMLESAERNIKFIPVHVQLTNGLIGKRVLFIKKGTQSLFDGIKTLADFRKKRIVGGMGQKWFDVKVWKKNFLSYKEEPGNWKGAYKSLNQGHIQYFSRGVNEILTESQEHPYLDIEKNITLIYNRDYKFYLSKKGKHSSQKDIDLIVDVLKNAQEEGLVDELVDKYWGNDLKQLNYENRVKIMLKTPQ